MSACAVELREVSKSYGRFRAVDNLSLRIPEGAIFGLIGPNGAGKTTSIRMIMDIIAPDRGEVRFFERARTRDDVAQVGYMPEERGLYPRMTVTDHLIFLGRLHGMSRVEATAASGVWLERVGLADWALRKVEELSKGMQQKVQLVGTVLHEPPILILDEPFSGLDPINQSLFKELLLGYRDRHRTVVFSTHIMEQAEKLCDQICLISGGRAILSGPLTEIKRQYGGNSYRLVASGEVERAAEVPGVESVVRRDGSAQLLLGPGVDGADVLRRLVEFLSVREFRSEEPGLEEIFIRAVRDAG